MTKRKLRGPASVRNKAKKAKPEDVGDSPENALEDASKADDDEGPPQPPATILKEEGQAALMADENNILQRMAELGDELEQESEDVTGDGNKDVSNPPDRSENDQIHDGLDGTNDNEEEEAIKTMLTQKVKIKNNSVESRLTCNLRTRR